MLELVTRVWFDVLVNLLQLVLSSILALYAYSKLYYRVKLSDTGLAKELILISAFSLLGILLPFNTFATLPVFFVLLKLNFKEYTVLPVIFSNMIYNMLVPFTDPTFIWKSGYRRVAAAFLIGLVAGIILRIPANHKNIYFTKKIKVEYSQCFNFKSMLCNLNQIINMTGIYLLAGVLLNTIFYKYIFYSLINWIFSNPKTAFLPMIFAGYNVVHPLFLLALNIVYALLNLTGISALLAVLKPKSLVLYICYFALWSILLGTSMFIHQ